MSKADRDWRHAPQRLLDLVAGPEGFNVVLWQNRTVRGIDDPPANVSAWHRMLRLVQSMMVNINRITKKELRLWSEYHPGEIPPGFGIEMIAEAFIKSFQFGGLPHLAERGQSIEEHLQECPFCRSLVLFQLDSVVCNLSRENYHFYNHMLEVPVETLHELDRQERMKIVEEEALEQIGLTRKEFEQFLVDAMSLKTMLVVLDKVQTGRMSSSFALEACKTLLRT
jgi:hypothetical protein